MFRSSSPGPNEFWLDDQPNNLYGVHMFFGYVRTPDDTDRLLDALRAALTANPSQRLGQLLTNVNRDCPDADALAHRLWNMHDEDWISMLNEKAEQ